MKHLIYFVFILMQFNALSQSDEPCGAPNLPVNPSCTFTTFTNATATASAGVPAPGCASYSGGDVWFTIIVPANGNVQVDANTGVITDGGMAIYSGTCGSLTLVECDDDDSPNGLMPYINLSGQTPGSTLWIRFWEYGNNNNGTFDICASEYTPATPPANDECSGAFPVTVNPDLNCGSTTAGTVEGATASSQDATACGGTEDDDVWFSFVATATSHQISILNATGSTTDMYHSVWEGTCPALTLLAGSCSDPNVSTVSGLTIGQTYYIRAYTWTGTTGQTTDFDVCVGTLPPPPVNDECAGAFPVTVNPDLNCGSTTAGTIASATASPQDATACGGTEDDDVWFSFVATQTSHQISILNASGSTTDMYHSVWEGTCPALTLLAGSCSDPNVSTVSGLTIGQTYYIRAYTWTGTTGQTTDFDVCVGTLPPPPANDDCSGAISVPVAGPSSGCSPTSGSIASATASSQANDCSGTANDDVWYEFTAPSSGAVSIELSNIINSPTDLFHSVYINNCGTPGTAIVCSDPNTSAVTGLTPGTSYLIRIFSFSTGTGATTSFDLCIQETGPCGTPENQDYCVAPAILTEGVGDFSSTTSGTYTSDTPANLNSVFCGSIENNSWYEFVADATTETFPISFVGGTGCVNGVQAEVYEVTQDANGCCTNFTSMSNCYNPGNLTLGTVTATGLTIGNTYMLMFDGNAGAVCDFTVTGWGATGILPVELTDFKGIGFNDRNALSWRTESERNNDYFQIQKSIDGINFTTIGSVKGAGNSTTSLSYSFDDFETRLGTTYYRLKQFDFDGSSETSKTIAINRTGTKNEITSVAPNPASDIVNIQFHSTIKGEIQLLNIEGKILRSESISGEGVGTMNIDLSFVQSGVYFIAMKTEDGSTSIEKIIKK